jgi:hypothetical protein
MAPAAQTVIAGLDTTSRFTRLVALIMRNSDKPEFRAIHPLRQASVPKKMDPRVKPAGDEHLTSLSPARSK